MNLFDLGGNFMKYYVTHRISARYVVEVDAENIEEAKKEAEIKFSEADFGEAEDIDGTLIVIEDENGNYLYER